MFTSKSQVDIKRTVFAEPLLNRRHHRVVVVPLSTRHRTFASLLSIGCTTMYYACTQRNRRRRCLPVPETTRRCSISRRWFRWFGSQLSSILIQTTSIPTSSKNTLRQTSSKHDLFFFFVTWGTSFRCIWKPKNFVVVVDGRKWGCSKQEPQHVSPQNLKCLLSSPLIVIHVSNYSQQYHGTVVSKENFRSISNSSHDGKEWFGSAHFVRLFNRRENFIPDRQLQTCEYYYHTSTYIS